MTESKGACRKRVCILATVPFALKWFMSPHIIFLKEKCDLTLVANGSSEDLAGLLGKHVSFVPIRIERKISIKDDVLALIKLGLFFRKEKFDCVYSIMPKAGLLSMLASCFVGIPTRLCVFNGEVWANKTGFMRGFLKLVDKIAARCATIVLAVGPSQRKILIDNNIVKENKVHVIADGSIAGVKIERFSYNADAHYQIRLQNKIPEDAIVFLFVGRLSHDKGLLDLSRAFSEAAEQDPKIHLLVVGPDEAGLEGEFTFLATLFSGRVHRVGFTDCPEHYMSAADVLCLPSYREGFSTVIIEAAAVGLPAIASRIYGIADTMVDGVTGILHKPASYHEIAEAMLLVASDESLRRNMGEAARMRAIDMFSEERVLKAFAEFYNDIFSAIKV